MRKTVAIVALTLVFGTAALVGGPQGPAGPAPARAASVDRFAPDEVLIAFQPNATDFDKSEARGWVNARRKQLIRRDGLGGELELTALPPGMPVELAVGVLSRHPAVRFAEPNWAYTHQATSNDPYYTNGSLWGMYGDLTSPANQFGSQAGEAWAAGHTGSSTVLVGVIDEGIDLNHPDLSANIWTNPFDPVDGIDNDGNGYIDDVHGWDFTGNNNTIFDGGPGSSVDQHGTHVAGTIGAKGGNGAGVAGVNWSVKIVSAKFLGPAGGSTANAIKAIDYMTDLKTRHGLNLVATNNSWGGGGYSQGLLESIIRGAKAGILFMAAAGNGNNAGVGQNNDSTANYPSNYNTTVGTLNEPAASYDAVIAVAAITSSGSKSSFSNYGATTVDLWAPGSGVWSTTPNNTYSSFSGTSMATPHVTGAAALYLSMNPGASAATIKNALLASAQNTPTASLSGMTVTGGRLNIGWLAGGSPPPSNTAPTVTISSPTNGASFQQGTSVSFIGSATDTQDGSMTSSLVWSSSLQGQIGTGGAFSYSALQVGTHVVTAGVTDSGGLSGSSSVNVTITQAPTAITLSAKGYKVKGLQKVDLTWTGSTSVRILRGGAQIATATGSKYTDPINRRGGGSYSYLVCDMVTSNCSNTVTVVF